jgi:putative multiple sugar transport system substrate-binding protein
MRGLTLGPPRGRWGCSKAPFCLYHGINRGCWAASDREPAWPGMKNTEYAPGEMMSFRAWTRGRTTLKTFTTTMAAVALGAFGLLGAAQAQDKGTVGVAMPTKSSARWIDDGNNMVKVLKEKGYNVDLQYAEDDIPNQLAQIENMITKGSKVLVIAAIDGTTLSDALQQAADKGIKVIAYDRLIRNSKNVDYYATFDNFQVGVLQGGYIEKALGLKEGKGPFNIELFGGSPDDNNAFFFYNGAMSVLDPYIKSGKLKVASGQTGMDKVSTLRWDGAVAQARMDNLLSAYYTDKRVDAVLSPYDGLSIGIISSLKGVGYGTPKQPMPVITGQDAEVQSVKSILSKEQTSTVFKDTRELAKVTVNMVDAVLSGKQPEVNDTKTYENGVKTVPSYLLKPVSVDASNWKEVLVGSGYYKEDQFK